MVNGRGLCAPEPTNPIAVKIWLQLWLRVEARVTFHHCSACSMSACPAIVVYPRQTCVLWCVYRYLTHSSSGYLSLPSPPLPPTLPGHMNAQMTRPARPLSFTSACAVSAMLVVHAGTPATSLAFTPPPVTNGSASYADHHRPWAAHNARASGDSASNNNKLTPVRLRRGRGRRGLSLFSRLRASASADGLFNKSGARGGGGGGEGNHADGARRDGGGSEATGCSATASPAAAAGVFKDGEPFVLEGVKNIRDLSSVEGYGIAPGRVFRTGHLSDATERDAKTLRDSTGLHTLVSAQKRKRRPGCLCVCVWGVCGTGSYMGRWFLLRVLCAAAAVVAYQEWWYFRGMTAVTHAHGVVTGRGVLSETTSFFPEC